MKYVHNLGVKITKLHRAISFTQSTWLKPYIQFNNEKRREAEDDLSRDFFKLLHNSIYGKTMEHIRNRVDIKLTTDDAKAVKLFSKFQFKSSILIDGLHLVEFYKQDVEYNKPLYLGTTILDLSK